MKVIPAEENIIAKRGRNNHIENLKYQKETLNQDQNSMRRKSEETLGCDHNWPTLSNRQSAASLISWSSFQGAFFSFQVYWTKTIKIWSQNCISQTGVQSQNTKLQIALQVAQQCFVGQVVRTELVNVQKNSQNGEGGKQRERKEDSLNNGEMLKKANFCESHPQINL